MAKTEVVSLLIAFFYTMLAISLSSVTNYFLVPLPDMTSIGISAISNPIGAIMSMMGVYFSSILPIGPGMIILIVLIAVALIVALFANERVALGLIGSVKVLMVYLGITLAFFLMIEGSILKSTSVYSAESAFPMIGVLVLISSVIGFIIFFALAFVVGKPKRRTIFQDN